MFEILKRSKHKAANTLFVNNFNLWKCFAQQQEQIDDSLEHIKKLEKKIDRERKECRGLHCGCRTK